MGYTLKVFFNRKNIFGVSSLFNKSNWTENSKDPPPWEVFFKHPVKELLHDTQALSLSHIYKLTEPVQIQRFLFVRLYQKDSHILFLEIKILNCAWKEIKNEKFE